MGARLVVEDDGLVRCVPIPSDIRGGRSVQGERAFGVVACGFVPAAHAQADATAPGELPAPTAAGFLDEAVDLLVGLPTDLPVLLVHGGTRESERRVAVLRAVARDHELLSMGVPRPVTGRAAAAALLAALAAHDVPVGVAASYLVQRHAELIPTYAVTASVAGLDLPFVRLRHHLMSWLPGTVFSVALDARPRITTGRLQAVLPQAEGMDLVVAGQIRFADRLAGVTPAVVVETFQADHGAEASQWWGGSRFYEQTLLPRDLDELLAQVTAQPVTPCPQCRRPVTGPCPFCPAGEARPA